MAHLGQEPPDDVVRAISGKSHLLKFTRPAEQLLKMTSGTLSPQPNATSIVDRRPGLRANSPVQVARKVRGCGSQGHG